MKDIHDREIVPFLCFICDQRVWRLAFRPRVLCYTCLDKTANPETQDQKEELGKARAQQGRPWP